ncbi:hypothetical protein SAMN04487968_101480 [Nocardioides terrae]|uniref:Uncharacterized protein n=1 Tax=Nocardioides terrae TaxID=574651 RepID=A0A1I1DSR1_9ACTN|nr:DUF6766 family protein [Nocardioides terrae]SFB78005.1 hypothetical protein SAMN04487968_101480 [Nocardioides terrae]
MKKTLKGNGLGLAFGLLFLATLVAQSFAGWQEFNTQQASEGLVQLSWWRYVASADFGVDVAENWQSEFLQFWLYLMATVWLVQRGSPESKELGEEGRESDQDQMVGEHAEETSPRWARVRGWRLRIYSRSLGYVMGTIFLLSWLVQSIAGRVSFNEERLEQLQGPVTWTDYITRADFWSRTLQNWQSEFLAVGSMAVLAIFLRQRGSSQSKPVGAPHSATGVDG